MNSRQLGHSLASEDNIVQYAAVCRAQNSQMNSRMNRNSETVLTDSGLTTPQDGSMTKLCDDIAAKIEARIKKHRVLHEQGRRRPLPGNLSPALSRGSGKCGSKVNPMSSAGRDIFTQTKRVIPEREVICVSLKKDPKLGVGVVIVGEDTVGKYDLGIFIASIVRGGPADKDGRIRPGGRLISLNHTSLEGMTFSEAAEVMQNSPQEVTLIVTQPKVSSTPNNMRSPLLKNYESQTTLMTNVRSGEDDLDEIVSVMLTPKTGSRLQLPDVRILNAQDGHSRSPSTNCFLPQTGVEISVELKKKAGVGLGISIAGGVNTGLRHGGVYIKSLVCGGAAEQDGRIQSGDRLLNVDGIRFQGFTYQQAVECLAKTGKVVTLVLERENMNSLPRVSLSPDIGCSLSPQSSHRDITQKRNNSCPAVITPFLVKPKDYSFVSDGNTLEVTLNKRLNGLGFSFLVPELDPSKGDSGSSLVRIKKLFPGQPAEESGRIQEGDVILAVNGVRLKGLSYQRVVTLLRGSPPEVRLSLCRPAPGILPPIETLFGT
uniref:PDZ domain-containing protein n=1 Tax=Hucho hucho TaxID=62062 RepID=A0A4W5MQS0_9TELE